MFQDNINRYLLSKGLECMKKNNFESNPKRIYLIISNSEIFNGIIEDEVTPKIKESIKDYNYEIYWSSLLPFNDKLIEFEINNAINKGAEYIIITKGYDTEDTDILSLCKNIS